MNKIHPTSDIQSTSIGHNTVIWQYVVILKEAIIGDNCNINSHCFIENDVVLGNNVTVKCGVYIWNGITIKDNVFIGPNVTFVNDKTPRSKQYPLNFEKTLIKKGVTIGANSTIIGGITIGEFAMVGAASLVTKNVPDHALVYGSPAIIKGYVCNCGKKLNNHHFCRICNIQFKI